nr:MAG TPA: hypothetical protein [Caudoviricetes sp.]
MIELSNSTTQTLESGQALLFDVTNLKTRCTAECHRAGMSDIKLRIPGIYEVAFSGNIAGVAAGAVQLSISAGNAVLPGSTMIATSTAAGDANNVAKTMLLGTGCGMYDVIRIVNSGASALTVAPGANIVIRKLS